MNTKILLPLLVASSPIVAPALQAQEGIDFFDESVIRSLELHFEDGTWPDVLEEYWPYVQTPSLNITAFLDGTMLPNTEVMYHGGYSFLTTPTNPWGVGMYPWEIELDDEIGDLDEFRLKNTRSLVGDVGFMRRVLALRIFRRHMPAQRTGFMGVSVTPHPDMGPLPDWYDPAWVFDPTSLGIYAHQEHTDGRFLDRRFHGDGEFRFSFTNLSNFNPTPPNLPAGVWLGGNTDIGDWNCDDFCPQQMIYDICDALDHPVDVPGTPEFRAALADGLDIDAYLWSMACWLAVQNRDGFQSKLLEDRGNGRLVLFPHDMNDCFSQGLAPHQIDPPTLFGGITDQIMADGHLALRYLHHQRRVIRNSMNPAGFTGLKDIYRGLIANHDLGQDQSMWINGSFPDPSGPFVLDGGAANDALFDANFDVVLDSISDRYTELVSDPLLNRPEAPILKVAYNKNPIAETANVVEARALALPGSIVQLYWRSEGAYQPITMVDDGSNGDAVAGDFVYTAAIPPLASGSFVDFYIEVITNYTQGEDVFDPASMAAAAYWPENAEMDPIRLHVANAWNPGDIVINEFLIGDGGGDQNEWVEIYNDGDTSVDLSGWSLDDDVFGAVEDPGDTEAFTFAAGTMLAPGEFLRIWTNADLQTANQALFNMKHKEGVITLRDGAGAMADIHRYLRQTERISEGRITDGAPVWVKFTNPTPDATNGNPIDLNSDGEINTSDLLILLGNFGSFGIDIAGDFNGDWVVDNFDIQLFNEVMNG